jgi:hypothetical protein
LILVHEIIVIKNFGRCDFSSLLHCTKKTRIDPGGRSLCVVAKSHKGWVWQMVRAGVKIAGKKTAHRSRIIREFLLKYKGKRPTGRSTERWSSQIL